MVLDWQRKCADLLAARGDWILLRFFLPLLFFFWGLGVVSFVMGSAQGVAAQVLILAIFSAFWIWIGRQLRALLEESIADS